MASRLPVGTATIPYVDESSNLKINDASRYVAEQAYSPFTESAEPTSSTTTVSSFGVTAIPGMSVTIAVPVRSKAFVSVILDCKPAAFTGAGLDVMSFYIYRDGTSSGKEGNAYPQGLSDRRLIPLQYLYEDMRPGNNYTFDVRALKRAGSSNFTAYQIGSIMSVRIEGYPRVI